MTALPNAAAFEWDGAPVDRERFYQIACDPRRSVAVEACAGAGKTWMLVSRMVRALLMGSAPQEILAITFTKKAAGEMRQRLQEWLHQFGTASDETLQNELRNRGFTQPATPAQLATLRGLHGALLRGGRPVQIRTFHSWFAALLRTAPLGVLHDLGLPSAYQLLEDDKKATSLVWRRFQSLVAQDAGARADYSEAVQVYGRFNAHKALESALAKRTEFALADAQGVVEDSVQPFAQQFPDFAGFATPEAALQSPDIRALLQRVATILGQQKGAKCQQAAIALELALTEGRDADIADALLTQKGEARKLGDKFAEAEVVQQAQDYLLRLNQVQLQHAAWQHQQRMLRLTRILIDEYAQLKREHGWIDMGDLERAALALLRDEVLSGWVQERLDARVRHLLIDEFQDTNPLQWQALHAWLSGYTGAGSAPSVFIVGDPKQSIYRFRRAEPQVFLAAKAFVKQGLGGDLLSCDHTRRNAQSIIATVNAVMGEAQARQEFEGFRTHTTESADAGRVLQLPAIGPTEPRSKLARETWRDSLTTPRFEEEESRKVLECRQAAHWLKAQMQASGGTLRPQDVMVLARKRERLGLMQAELAALAIPSEQPEKSDLIDFAEVQDIVALLDALVSPQHDLSLARALKSPLFSVGDTDLVQLALQRKTMQAARSKSNAVGTESGSGTDAGISWMQVLQSGVELPGALQPAARQLALWKTWVNSMPPHDALSAIYHHGDVLARFAAAAPVSLRDTVVANLQALLHAALAVDGGRYLTAYRLVRALRAGGNKAPVRSNSAAMRLLTIHGAKGLEAPVVLLLDTDAREARAESMGALVDWPGEAPYPRRFIFLASESNPPACVADTLRVEQAERSREELNALYVALTRTQQTLVVSSLEPRTANPASWWTRITSHAQPVEMPLRTPPSIGEQTSEGPLSAFALHTLPDLPADLRWGAIALATAQLQPQLQPHSVESRMGQAMHRLLELLPVRFGGYRLELTQFASLWTQTRVDFVAQVFALDAQQMANAVAMAQRIAGGQAAWAWDADQLQFHANEVPISRSGRLLRIDRLVQLREGGAWWVLDYKSTATPQNDPELCDQLLGYRDCIAQSYGAATVRAAFLTPSGALIELTTP